MLTGLKSLLFTLLVMVYVVGAARGSDVIVDVDPASHNRASEETLHIQPGEPSRVSEPTWTPDPLKEPNEQWVEATLATMTLDEKIGQMLMPQWSSGSASTLLQNYHVGGFIFLRNSASTIESATSMLQSEASTPLLFSIDCEAGSGARINEGVRFPMNMGLAATNNPDFAYQQGVVTARECRALGVHIGLGPVLDVNTEPINPIIGIRSLGDDPDRIYRMAKAYVEGARSAGLLTTYKHFPGHGATTGDSHDSLPTVTTSYQDMLDIHVNPYARLINDGIGELVMSAHVWYTAFDPGQNAWPGTLSEVASKDILRDDLGFDGVYISDAFNMQGLQLAATTAEGVKIAVKNGMDIILMAPSNFEAFNALKDAVMNEEISEERIDTSVRRILRLKSQVGLDASSTPRGTIPDDIVGHPFHWQTATDIGKEAVSYDGVERGTLPIDKDESIIVFSFETNSSIFYLESTSYFQNELNDKFNDVTWVDVPRTLGQGIINDYILDALQKDRVMIVSWTWQPDNSFWQSYMIEEMRDAFPDLLYVSFGSPYQLREEEDRKNFFCGFSSHRGTQIGMAEVLAGERIAAGDWPVDINAVMGPSSSWLFE